MTAPVPHPSHGAVCAATIVTNDLDSHRSLYMRDLGYRQVEAGGLDAGLAVGWGASGLAGAPFATLASPSGADSFLRLVEDRTAQPHAPMATLGWASLEVVVADVDGLQPVFDRAPWRIIGPPADLSFTDAIRAMQVAGPMGEVLYLTLIKRPVPGFDLPAARAPIDRLFVHILGCRDADRSAAFHSRLFGRPAAPAFAAEIRVVNRCNGLPAGTRIPMATITLGGESLLEMDGFPPTATTRPSAPGRLPAGIAIAGYRVAELDRVEADFIAAPAHRPGVIYGEQRSAVVRGPDGELLELVELPR